MHTVAVPWQAGDGSDFLGSCLLLDGAGLLCAVVGVAHEPGGTFHDPELHRLAPAGAAAVAGYNGCTLLADGRVLLVPCNATNRRFTIPCSDTFSNSAAVTPVELQTGWTSVPGSCCRMGAGATGAQPGAQAVDLRPGGGQRGGGRRGVGWGELWERGAVGGWGGCYCRSDSWGEGKTVIFDPASDTIAVTAPPSHPGGYQWRRRPLADGRVLLLPGQNGDLVDCRIWDAEVDTYGAAPELVGVPAIGQGAYAGGCVLGDGRVVFAPYYSRHLVVWEPGLGACFGRDVALSGFWNRWP